VIAIIVILRAKQLVKNKNCIIKQFDVQFKLFQIIIAPGSNPLIFIQRLQPKKYLNGHAAIFDVQGH